MRSAQLPDRPPGHRARLGLQRSAPPPATLHEAPSTKTPEAGMAGVCLPCAAQAMRTGILRLCAPRLVALLSAGRSQPLRRARQYEYAVASPQVPESALGAPAEPGSRGRRSALTSSGLGRRRLNVIEAQHRARVVRRRGGRVKRPAASAGRGRQGSRLSGAAHGRRRRATARGGEPRRGAGYAHRRLHASAKQTHGACILAQELHGKRSCFAQVWLVSEAVGFRSAVLLHRTGRD